MFTIALCVPLLYETVYRKQQDASVHSDLQSECTPSCRIFAIRQEGGSEDSYILTLEYIIY